MHLSSNQFSRLVRSSPCRPLCAFGWPRSLWWLVHGMLPQGPTMSSVQLHTHYAYSDDYNGGVGRGNAWRLQTDEQRIIGRG